MHSVVFKNDAVGDLIHSLEAIHNVTESKENDKVTIFLSKRTEKYSFLVEGPKVNIKILNFDLNIIEKIKLFFFLFNNSVTKIYILTPKKFYYYLPFFFKKIKFFAICVNNINNYKRPNLFLRKYLYKFEVNDRSKIFKRDSIIHIQNRLTKNADITKFTFNKKITESEELFDRLPNEYVYFHYKKKRFDDLGWKTDQLDILLNNLNKYSKKVVFTKDIDIDKNNSLFKEKFNSYDFKTREFIEKKKNIIFFDNIEGANLLNVIKYSKKVISFHGMMTSIAFLLKKPILDLFFIESKGWNDYRKYRNSFYEFKPKFINYDFIIPRKNINKTIKKMEFSLKKCLTK